MINDCRIYIYKYGIFFYIKPKIFFIDYKQCSGPFPKIHVSNKSTDAHSCECVKVDFETVAEQNKRVSVSIIVIGNLNPTGLYLRPPDVFYSETSPIFYPLKGTVTR